ncbi:MAG TPA: nitrate reductase [Burkholderiaceae bacterium]|nr:nitrate reductase [Burkholderiaceae bacterium]
MANKEPNEQVAPTRGEELRAAVLASLVVAPVLAVVAVGGYGFLVWMVQLLTGPPGN